MKELLSKVFASKKNKIISGIIAVIIAAVCAYFGIPVADVIPSEKTQAVVGGVVGPAPAPAPVENPKPIEEK